MSLVEVLAWVVGLALAVGIAMAGASKLRGARMLDETRDRLGVADGLWNLIGGLELLAAAGLVIGLSTDNQDAEWLGFLAAIGLIVLLAGALVYHVRAADPPREWMGAILMLVLSVLYLVFIGGR